MSSKTMLTASFQSIVDDITKRKNDFKDAITDKEHSLEWRWETFCKYGHLFGDHEHYHPYFEIENKAKAGEISWYDDFGIDRYRTVRMDDIIESVEDSLDDEDDDNVWTQELVDEWKEEILRKNLYSFKYDW